VTEVERAVHIAATVKGASRNSGAVPPRTSSHSANCHFFRKHLKRNADPPRSHKESDIMGVLVEAGTSRKAA
jgi:hypothetical protein